MTRALAIAAVMIIAGCTGRTSTPPATPEHGSAIAAGSSATPPAPPPGPSDAECTQLIDHAVALGVTRHRETAPSPDKIATVEETAAIRAEVDAELRPGCRALDRAAYRCGLAATTLEAFIACDEPASRQAE